MQRHFCQSEPESKWNAVTSLTRCFDFLLYSSDVWRYSRYFCASRMFWSCFSSSYKSSTFATWTTCASLWMLLGLLLYILNVYDLLLVLLALLILLVLLALLLLLLDSSNVWRWKFCTSAGCLAAACLLAGKLKGTSLQSHV